MRGRAKLAIAAAVCAAATAWYAWPHQEDRDALALRFALGTEYDYTLAWHDRSAVTVAGASGALAGHVDLVGRLVVRAYEQTGDRFVLGMRFADLTTHDVVVLGRAIPADTLAGAEAFVEVRADGQIASVRFERGAPELVKQLVPVLLTELDARLAGGTAEAPAPFGIAQARYARTGAREVTRTRDRYTALTVAPIAADELARTPPQLAASATVEIAAAGPWQRVVDRERLQLGERVDAEVSLELALAGARAARLPRHPPLAQLERRELGDVRPGGDAERNALVHKVGGLTRRDLLDGLSSNGAIADANRWMWRASGLVELEPALAAEIGELVATGRLAGTNAELALDVLAAAGTPAAQRALVAALSSPVVQGAARYSLLLQRISLVAQPTPETAAFIGATYRRDHAGAAAYALGAVVGHLGDSAEAGAWNATLAGDLERARDPGMQRVLLAALGNAARVDNVDRVTRYATSDDAGVRAAVARALRRTDTPTARATLHALFGDRSSEVQHDAIAALASLHVTPADLASLREHVAAAGVHAGNESSLVGLVADQVASADAAALLRDLAARPDTPREVRARIATLLHRG
jgi:HEAT repeat protein